MPLREMCVLILFLKDMHFQIFFKGQKKLKTMFSRIYPRFFTIILLIDISTNHLLSSSTNPIKVGNNRSKFSQFWRKLVKT